MQFFKVYPYDVLNAVDCKMPTFSSPKIIHVRILLVNLAKGFPILLFWTVHSHFTDSLFYFYFSNCFNNLCSYLNNLSPHTAWGLYFFFSLKFNSVLILLRSFSSRFSFFYKGVYSIDKSNQLQEYLPSSFLCRPGIESSRFYPEVSSESSL